MNTLFDTIPSPLEAKFAAFHAAHPEVYRAFRAFAWELVHAGHDRGSAQQILERIRWDSMVNAGRDGGYKVNNWFRTLYARMLVAESPEVFGGFFEFRVARAGC